MLVRLQVMSKVSPNSAPGDKTAHRAIGADHKGSKDVEPSCLYRFEKWHT
jgi:hypothetical protein